MKRKRKSLVTEIGLPFPKPRNYSTDQPSATYITCDLDAERDWTRPPKGKCNNCGTRKATEWWAPEGLLGVNHGVVSAWCEYCVVSERIKFAKEVIKGLPELEQRLKELE